MRWKYLALIAAIAGFCVGLAPVWAETNCDGKSGDDLYSCLGTQISELTKSLEASKAATAPLESEIQKLSARIMSIQSQINAANAKQKQTEADIKVRSEKVSTQYVVLGTKVREMYKRLRSEPLWASLLTQKDMGELRRELAYRQESNDKDRQIIVTLVQEINQLETDKKNLEIQKAQLTKLQADLDKQSNFFENEVAKAKAYQADLSGKIAALSAKQQAILEARSGSFITSVGSVPIGSDYNASIAGFNENAPSGYFAVFSFGAYTHRKGMSQYGAKARAESQDYETILEAYYGKRPVNKDTGGSIKVSGYGDLEFETAYMYGVAEMPSDWPEQALKAQAVAARTFAYRYKTEGKTIGTSEGQQVYLKSKADNVPAAWKKAVDETKGKVLDNDVAYYSSSAGGYLSTSGWDTTDRTGNGEWTSRAWESKSGNPWFYKAWYRNGYKNSDNNCGRNPWMSEEEMADIINSWLVLKQGEGNGVDTGRILPVTIKSCNVGGQSGDPYSVSELRSKISNPVTSISGKPVVTNNNSGTTTNIKFATNRGDINIPGAEFKEVFNTRAPGYISIPQRGFTFINIERK